MVSIIPIHDVVDNIILANATIDDSFEYLSHDLPVAVPIEPMEYLIAEKLSLCFKMKETCYLVNENCQHGCSTLCCITTMAVFGYFICGCPLSCPP